MEALRSNYYLICNFQGGKCNVQMIIVVQYLQVITANICNVPENVSPLLPDVLFYYYDYFFGKNRAMPG